MNKFTFNARPRISLGAIILILAALIRICLALHYEKAFDEGWNTYYNNLNSIEAWLAELRFTAHPFLHNILLVPFIALGSEIFWARALSIVAGLISIWLTARILTVLKVPSELILLSASLMAISHSHVNISIVVRSHVIYLAFCLAALLCLMRLLTRPAELRLQWAFAAASAAAIWADYVAIVVIFLLMVLYALVPLLGAESVKVRLSNLRLMLWPSIFVLVNAIACIFWFKRGALPFALGHTASFYYNSSNEPVYSYLALGLKDRLFAYFTPLTLLDRWSMAYDLSCYAVGILLLVFGIRSWINAVRQKNFAAAIVIGMTIAWPIVTALLGLLGLYPYGGWMRHQILFLPLLTISVILIVGPGYGQARSRRKAILLIWIALIFLSSSVRDHLRGPIEEFPPAPMYKTEGKQLQSYCQKGDVYYFTGLSQFTFHYLYPEWTWTLKQSLDTNSYAFELTKGGDRVEAIVDRNFWLAPWNASQYSQIAQIM